MFLWFFGQEYNRDINGLERKLRVVFRLYLCNIVTYLVMWLLFGTGLLLVTVIGLG